MAALTTTTVDKNADGTNAGGAGNTLPPHLAKAMSKLTDIGSLPEITTKVVAVVEDPKATAHQLHEIIKNDPALAAKILKVVNSAFYGLPSQIASLDRAIAMLGLNSVKNIALAASLSRFFNVETKANRFSPRDLWTHCVAVGVCAKLLANIARLGQADEAFVAGLMHDVGLLAELQLFPEQVNTIADKCAKSQQDFCAVEREIIGADHQAFGMALTTKWKFPPGLRNAIGYHHNPAGLKPEFFKFTTLVYAADTLCCAQGHGFSLTATGQPLTDETIAFLGLTDAALGEVIEALPEHVKDAERIFAE